MLQKVIVSLPDHPSDHKALRLVSVLTKDLAIALGVVIVTLSERRFHPLSLKLRPKVLLFDFTAVRDLLGQRFGQVGYELKYVRGAGRRVDLIWLLRLSPASVDEISAVFEYIRGCLDVSFD